MADKKRSPELIALAVRLYEELKSTQKVAKRLELGASTTHRLLIGAGVKMPDRHAREIQDRKKALHGERAKQVANDYAAGMSLAEMRKKYGVGTWAIRTAAKDNGVPFRERGGRWKQFSETDRKEIVRLHDEENWSQKQIAVKFGSSAPMIGRFLREMRIQTRTFGCKGSEHASWNGGRVKIGGYAAVLVDRDDPMQCMAHHTGYVMEHRLVMARAIGRPLTEHETVHHLDDNKLNNALSNLQLRFGRHGKGVVLKCRSCGGSDIVPVEL